MSTQAEMERFLGVPRFATYVAAAAGDVRRAAELYRWNQQLSGALHAQIAYVEVAVRNAIDRALADWNSVQSELAGQPHTREWTRDRGSAALLYAVLGRDLRAARRRAAAESERRAVGHPRHGVAATHGDVVAQLMFGSWCRLLDDPHARSGPPRQLVLWQEAVHRAFPRLSDDDVCRRRLAARLDRVRALRNRVAHHDSVLSVDVGRRLNDMLSVLADIDPAYPGWAMAGSLVRRFVRRDPRRARAG